LGNGGIGELGEFFFGIFFALVRQTKRLDWPYKAMMKYRGGVFLRFCGLFVGNCIVYGDKIEKKLKKNCEKKKKKIKTEK
jgi:hypothetical protein